MSGGAACRCLERQEPITVAANANRPARLWRVLTRYGNYSAFNGGHFAYSDYSSCTCLRCGAVWRTKSPYVGQLRDCAEDERWFAPGYDGYEARITALGREPYSSREGHI